MNRLNKTEERSVVSARKGSVKSNETEILLLRRKIRELEERVKALES